MVEVVEPSVMAAQRTFRAVLEALAEPAQPVLIEADDAAPGLRAPTADILKTLVDVDTPVWIDGIDDGLREWLAFETGAPLVEDTRARFAVIRDVANLLPLDRFAQGDPEYPDRSATILWEVPVFDGPPMRFDGPGFDAPRTLQAPWPEGFAAAWRRNRAAYPLGVDLVLISPDRIAGLPRSSHLMETA